MVYFQIWDEYQHAAEEMYQNSPSETRYVSSYRHCDGKLVLKVTDNRTCIKYATDQLNDLKKFDRLNHSLMAKMLNVKEVSSEMKVERMYIIPLPADLLRGSLFIAYQN
ncbi:SRP9-domain-containing protein [Basidiobolus meristosporus CBS 931.73]|uniref:Signal recognition particle 9 kDa protein n=1 Tax=Basidiobolus meristosporus CBS 931.73 TaxID=1314790 RepID=A0A1Y1W702_9FUNG|nr:SRP9-domain-containing protein [Basidiobolus meristosporus CBS 931.73]|eukprot:ORX69330.1 SRP9-domain-containing protein [Basidiobolus meristosporus CBS 931.73]